MQPIAARWIPFVGWALLGKDVYSVWAPAAAENMKSYNEAHPIEKEGNLIYHICFIKGTLVSGKDSLMPIENIKSGDSVFSYNLTTNKVELSKVLNILQRHTNSIYELIIGKERIYVTAEHPFYVIGKGWVVVKDLKFGDRLKTSSNKSVKVKMAKLLNRDAEVYNIEVDNNHNYFVTDKILLVHNKNIFEQNQTQNNTDIKNNLNER